MKAIISATFHKDPQSEQGFMRIHVPSEDHRLMVAKYAREMGPGPHRMVIEELADPMTRAKNLFYALRDRLAVASGDTSRENKEQIKEALKQDFGARDDTGALKSLSATAEPPYDMDDIRQLITGSIWQCAEEQVDVEDLIAEKRSIDDADGESEAGKEDG